MDNKFSNNYGHLIFLLLIISLFILIFPAISAVRISMDSNFSQGETLVAVVSGNFINQITTNNVQFYRGHTQIPINDGVVNINGDYYVYAILAGSQTQFLPGQYSVNISGVQYYTGSNQIASDTFGQNFTITNDTFAFSANPGVINTQNDFSVQLANLLNQKITLTYGVKGNTSSGSSGFFSSLFGGSSSSTTILNPSTVTVNTGQTATIPFSILQLNQTGLVYIEFTSQNSTFDMPVYLNINQTQQGSSSNANNGTIGTTSISQGFSFQPSLVNVSMATSNTTSRILYLTNTGNQTINSILFNISSSLQPYITISPASITSLNSGANQQVTINIASGSSNGATNGNVTAYTGNLSTSFNLALNFINNFVPSQNTTIVTTCSQLNGTVCTSTQTCSGQVAYTSDNGVCCLNPWICSEQQQGSFGWIGWALIIIALIAIYLFYKKKYKKVQPKKPF